MTIQIEEFALRAQRITGEAHNSVLFSHLVDRLDLTQPVVDSLARAMKSASVECASLGAIGMGAFASAKYEQAVRQLPRQLVLPPSPSLEFLARHRGEVGSLHIVQVGVESARHANRRIPFATPRNPLSHPSPQARSNLMRQTKIGGCERFHSNWTKVSSGRTIAPSDFVDSAYLYKER